jgi:hypothetical protein
LAQLGAVVLSSSPSLDDDDDDDDVVVLVDDADVVTVVVTDVDDVDVVSGSSPLVTGESVSLGVMSFAGPLPHAHTTSTICPSRCRMEPVRERSSTGKPRHEPPATIRAS